MRQITERNAPGRWVESPAAAGGVRRIAATWLALAFCALAAGCQDGQGPQGKLALTPLQDVTEFNREVVQSKQPVLVDFYKDSCPTCVWQDEEVLQGLAFEYQGHVKFVRFKIREATMASNCPEFMDQHKLFWVPTAILFVNGKEQQRWELNHGAWEFRDALNAAGGRPLFSGSTVAQKGGKPPGTPVVDVNGCIEGVGCPIDRPPPATVGKANGTGAGAGVVP